MKELLLPIAGVIAFVIVVGIFIQKGGNLPVSLGTQGETKEVQIGNTKVTAEVANTQDKRANGLSGRVSLDNNQGMLFVFDGKKVFPSIWMKDMLFPIDIIWITEGKVAKIDSNVQAPVKGTPDGNLKLYYPDKPVDYVLEVNAGFSEKNNIHVGDKVDIPEI